MDFTHISFSYKFRFVCGLAAVIFILYIRTVTSGKYHEVKAAKENEEIQAPAYAFTTKDTSSGRCDINILPVQNYQQTLIYNRVPKCGSKGMRLLIAELGKLQNYTVQSVPFYHMKNSSLARVVDSFKVIPQPWVYIQHIHFIDFSLFIQTTPMYINLVRDPVDTFVSFYYYIRPGRDGKFHKEDVSFTDRNIDECVQAKLKECYRDSYMGIISYFCGHDHFCRTPVQKALLQAKRNVIKYFPLVGYLENIEHFLEVAEFVWPRFFKDALPVFKDMYNGKSYHTTWRKIPPNNVTRAILTRKMQLEYEFYHFIKQRFDCQYRQLLHTVSGSSL